MAVVEIANHTPTIVDKGRGMQLSNCRITVQDVVPDFKAGYTLEEIHGRFPMLSREEIDLLEAYWLAHTEELLEEDRAIEERAKSRKNPEWIEELRIKTRQRVIAAGMKWPILAEDDSQ